MLRGDTATTAFQGYWPSTAPVQPRTRVWGSDLPREATSGSATTSSPRTCWGSTCTYGGTAPVRLIVTNLRLPGQYDERLLGPLGLQGPYYNWNRWYLPGVGRYLEPDPVALEGHFNTPYGVDWYGYALQNPLSFVDPDGRCTIICHFGGYLNWPWRSWMCWRTDTKEVCPGEFKTSTNYEGLFYAQFAGTFLYTTSCENWDSNPSAHQPVTTDHLPPGMSPPVGGFPPAIPY